MPKLPQANLAFLLFAVYAAIACGGLPSKVAAEEQSPLQHALRQIFLQPIRPVPRSMGIFQRSTANMSDLLRNIGTQMEIGIVVDGTKSMGQQLNILREELVQMDEDLVRQGKAPHYALVVYRDQGAGGPDQQVNVQFREFDATADQMVEAMTKIQALSGEPYFYEMTDVGIHTAIHQLDWGKWTAKSKSSPNNGTNRWILLIGDAPPFPMGIHDRTGAKRHHSTRALVSNATEKKITISCIICPSEEKSSLASYQRVLPETREFMHALSNDTSGRVIDLSIEEVRRHLAEMAALPRHNAVAFNVPKFVAPDKPMSESKELSVLVLPFGKEIDFTEQSDGAMRAWQLMWQLQHIPQLKIIEWADVEDIFHTHDANDPESAIPNLQTLHSIDCIIRADMGSDNLFHADTWLLEDNEAKKATTIISPLQDLSLKIAQLLAKWQDQPDMLNDRIKRDLQYPMELRDSSTEASMALLRAMFALEKQFVVTVGDEQSVANLKKHYSELSKNGMFNFRTPLSKYVQYSYAANILTGKANPNDPADWAEICMDSLSEAYELCQTDDGRTPEDLQLEIQADYFLLHEKNEKHAVELYEKLLASDHQPNNAVARRAHWMLAGLYAGDWGASSAKDSSVKNLEKVGIHVQQIMDNWPESFEAELYRTWFGDDPASHPNFMPLLYHDHALAIAK